jgi:cysteine synthase A
MSVERRKLLAALGAEVVLTEGRLGMQGAIDKAEEMSREIAGAVILGQFTNPANAGIHKKTTGPEIWNDADGEIDFLVCGVGTGGTITGVGEYLKERKAAIKVVAVEPKESAVISGGEAGSHGIQGIGAGFVPKILNTDIIDEIIQIEDQEALDMQRELAKQHGLLVGISSGAAMAAAREIAEREENRGKNIIVVFPDTGERYLT